MSSLAANHPTFKEYFKVYTEAVSVEELQSAQVGDSFNIIEIGDIIFPEDPWSKQLAIRQKLNQPLQLRTVFKDIAYKWKHMRQGVIKHDRSDAFRGFIETLEDKAGGVWMTDIGDPNLDASTFRPDTPSQLDRATDTADDIDWNPISAIRRNAADDRNRQQNDDTLFLASIKVYKVDDGMRAEGFQLFTHPEPIEYWRDKKQKDSFFDRDGEEGEGNDDIMNRVKAAQQRSADDDARHRQMTRSYR